MLWLKTNKQKIKANNKPSWFLTAWVHLLLAGSAFCPIYSRCQPVKSSHPESLPAHDRDWNGQWFCSETHAFFSQPQQAT